jgi:hypothetical protein
MFYTIFIAICMSSTPAQDCGRDSAVDWIAVPNLDRMGGLSGCQIAGMEYAAQTRLVTPGTYAKIYCQPPRLAKSGPDCSKWATGQSGFPGLRDCAMVSDRRPSE